MSISPNIVAPTIPKIPMVSANFVRSKEGIPSRLSHTDAVSTVGAYGKASLYSINVRLVGVGFRATVLKIYLQELQEPFATSLSQSRFLRGDSAEGTYGARPAPKGGTPFIKVLTLKVGKSASTLYPIPSKVDIYCPTDQQQQAENQPFLVTSFDWHELTRVVSEIQSYKDIDPYKGSGIHICDRVETETGETFPSLSKHSRPLKEIKK